MHEAEIDGFTEGPASCPICGPQITVQFRRRRERIVGRLRKTASFAGVLGRSQVSTFT
jgi:hypothetical protein